MKLTVFGAAGEVGSRVVLEALTRGHKVAAVVRDPTQFHKLPQGLNPSAGDAGIIDDVVCVFRRIPNTGSDFRRTRIPKNTER